MKTESHEQALEFGSRRIAYRLQRDNYRTLRVKVFPDLTVKVHAPRAAADDEIRAVVRKKASWIARTLDRLEAYHPLPTPKRYISGETFYYLGRQYRLRVCEGEKQPARLHGRFLFVQIPNKENTVLARHLVEDWYAIRASDIFMRYVAECLRIGSRHGIPAPRVVIRRMKARWGSCNSKGLITLNINLVKAPAHCIQYVIMHELCHLKHHNHSKSFYSLLGRCMPDWQRRKKTLSQLVL
jgi:predicted metal-dependent hydrolase